MSGIKQLYKEKVSKKLQEKFGYENVHQIPKILKVVISRGAGESISNSKAIDSAVVDVRSISGQKPLLTKAKKSISNFKLREGQIIGSMVTLRNQKMYEFLEKLVRISLPKIRDFRGIPRKSFDGRGNYNLGIKDCTIFPEIDLDNLDKVRGFNISVITSANTNEEAFELLKEVGFPFRMN
ncbi:50S ribosomal protein L5 [bacterium]|jgi:large subunit ribosomal protein L5|nr:50S ribosomal protein L5 [bacterium]